jgi:hypothetical protein
MAVDRLAEEIGRLVAVESRMQNLDLRVGLGPRPVAEALPGGTQDVINVPVEILERPLPVEVDDDLPDCPAQAVLHRVVAPVGRRVGLDVLRRHRRPGKDVVVVEIRTVQDLRAHRVEEGLGEFRLLVVDQSSDIEQFELLPGGIVERSGAEVGTQQIGGLADAVIVGTNPFANGIMDALPVGTFEQQLGLLAVATDQSIVPVEAIDHRLGDTLGEHVCNSRYVHELNPMIRHGTIVAPAVLRRTTLSSVATGEQAKRSSGPEYAGKSPAFAT